MGDASVAPAYEICDSPHPSLRIVVAPVSTLVLGIPPRYVGRTSIPHVPHWAVTVTRIESPATAVVHALDHVFVPLLQNSMVGGRVYLAWTNPADCIERSTSSWMFCAVAPA